MLLCIFKVTGPCSKLCFEVVTHVLCHDQLGQGLDSIIVLVLVLHSCAAAVTVSSTGAKNQLQGDDNGH